jgi:error-prone DNA polymerase
LRGLCGNRHQARWQVLGIEAPLALGEAPALPEPVSLLRRPTEGEDIVADYGSLGLTLRRHPLALLRPVLTRLSFQSAREVVGLTHGRSAHAAGLVITRQRPGTATGVVFLTLEDETGPLNVIVWSSLFERERRIVLGARLMGVTGEVQREGEVVHLIAHKLEDRTALLGGLRTVSRDFC